LDILCELKLVGHAVWQLHLNLVSLLQEVAV
jgi:hypothetical protein